MIHIMLCCMTGMSSNLLVEKMKTAASDQGIQAVIWAIETDQIKANANKADVILLGPQAKYAQAKIEMEAIGIPIANIDMRDYGMMDGFSVLKQAIDMFEKK